MQQFVQQVYVTAGAYLPNLVAALAILILGWLGALLISAVTKGILNRTTLDNRIAAWTGLGQEQADFKIEPVIAKGVYYLILLFVLIAFFQTLGLTIITQPLNTMLNQVFGFLPSLLGAGALLALAWIIATGLKFVIARGLGVMRLDERLSNQAGISEASQAPLSETLANVIYWLVFLLFLPAILSTLNLPGLLVPIQGMIDDVLGYLPNLLGASLVVLVGWIVARIVRRIITGLLTALGADRLGERVGLATVAGDQTLSSVVGTVVYVLILIPTIIAGLNALQIAAISDPAANMLNTLLNAVPAIFGAMIVLGVTYLIGRLVAGLVTKLLASIGFDRILSLIGLGGTIDENQRTPSEIAGYLVLIGLMLFATIEAADLLGFVIVAELVATFLSFAGQVILGLIVFGLGLYLANLAHNVIRSTVRNQATLLAQAARLAIIVLGTAMALRQMGIAEDIVNLAFGLMLGAIAVAAALGLGLGARDVVADELRDWLRDFRSGNGKEPSSMRMKEHALEKGQIPSQ